VPPENPIVLFSLLSFSKGDRWKAVQHFARLRFALPKAQGARFVKVMGCGQGAVFSVWPDWGRYAFLTIWDNPANAADAFRMPLWTDLQARTHRCQHLRLKPLRSHGLWDGGDPFAPLVSPVETERTAVLTRADVKPWKLRSFSRHAAQTSAAILHHHGLQSSLGMGEWPFVRQATFSVWDSEAAMKAYAYKNASHIAAMRSKNKERWYGEELYARFAILAESDGTVADVIPATSAQPSSSAL